MGSSRLLIFFILPILLVLDPLAPAIADYDISHGVCTTIADYCWSCSNINNTFNNGSIYKQNLDTLLSSFLSNTQINSEFYSSSMGQAPDKVNAIAVCRGDLAPKDCHTCFNDSVSILLQNCTNQKEAIIWAERCTVRYSNILIFGVDEDKPVKFVPSPHRVTNAEQYLQVLNPLFENLSEKAAAGDSVSKFAAGHALVPATNQPIYATVQCSPDLDKQNCSDCLKESISDIPPCCGGLDGGRVLRPSCYLRFESNSGFCESAAYTLINLPGKQGGAGNDDQISTLIVVAIVVPTAILLFLVGCCFFRRRARKKYKVIQQQNVGNEINSVESLQFDLRTIEAATDNFSNQNRLGEGGFGEVYKGTLPDGQQIAVKRLSTGSGQGAEQFKNEVVLVAKLQHRNLVSLLGFCSEGEEKILVYELVQNKSLDHFLFDSENQVKLDWSSRYKIIGGIARGLLYLHYDSRLKIIHRDLKPGNILLDGDMNPKIADFGMARIVGVDETQGSTRRVVGTYGYMSPEYAMRGQFSVKSDVYSLGVLILEIVTGKKNTGFYDSERGEDLLTYAWRNWRDGTALELLDPNLRDSYAKAEVTRCVHIGLLCVQENPDERPTMQSIVLMLSSYSVTMALPQKPAFFLHSITELNMPSLTTTTESSDQPRSSSLPFSVNEASITELYPR